MAERFNYRAPVLDRHAPILQALKCCEKARCAECPYEYGQRDCDQILTTAQETIRGLAGEKQERMEAVMAEICDHYCKYGAQCSTQEELDETCASCPLGQWLEDKQWR